MTKVSICCSVLNQSELLKGMIHSIRAQSLTDWELVLVDDGSTEDIKSLVDSFSDTRIKLERFKKNKGMPLETMFNRCLPMSGWSRISCYGKLDFWMSIRTSTDYGAFPLMEIWEKGRSGSSIT